MKKAYVKTFLSSKTSNEHYQNLFTKNQGDEEMFQIFLNNKQKWQKAIGPKIKAWVTARLPFWLAERPEWFNEHAISIIPEEYIDDPKLLAHVRIRSVREIIQER